jgi:hypothetical protein
MEGRRVGRKEGGKEGRREGRREVSKEVKDGKGRKEGGGSRKEAMK